MTPAMSFTATGFHEEVNSQRRSAGAASATNDPEQPGGGVALRPSFPAILLGLGSGLKSRQSFGLRDSRARSTIADSLPPMQASRPPIGKAAISITARAS